MVVLEGEESIMKIGEQDQTPTSETTPENDFEDDFHNVKNQKSKGNSDL